VVRSHTADSSPLRLQEVRQNEVPKGREGKYKKIIDQILRRVDQLAPGAALKIPLAEIPAPKANIRAALNRGTHKRGLSVATSSDSSNLYIWKVPGKS
jgi:hypothetical protein